MLPSHTNDETLLLPHNYARCPVSWTPLVATCCNVQFLRCSLAPLARRLSAPTFCQPPPATQLQPCHVMRCHLVLVCILVPHQHLWTSFRLPLLFQGRERAHIQASMLPVSPTSPPTHAQVCLSLSPSQNPAQWALNAEAHQAGTQFPKDCSGNPRICFHHST